MAKQTYGEWMRSNPKMPTEEYKKEDMAQTAVDWFYQMILPKDTQAVFLLAKDIEVLLEQAKELEKQQHGQTWDAAIQAHDDRGHVHARSITDFDEYYNETFVKAD
jgi:hypothetical protein